MALSTLDPTTALILIDLQKGIVAMPTVHPGEDVVRQARALAVGFRAHGKPVVLVNVAGGAPGRTEQAMPGGTRPDDWTDLVPELEAQPSDWRATKYSWGGFTGTGLDEKLRGDGITHVVIAGIATSIGVETTARQAFELGYNVTLATDAMTDLSSEAHENSIARIFPRLGETGTTAEIVALLGA